MTFYHCYSSVVYFDEFHAYFSYPTSTTTQHSFLSVFIQILSETMHVLNLINQNQNNTHTKQSSKTPSILLSNPCKIDESPREVLLQRKTTQCLTNSVQN
eukprot:603365_1